MKKTVAARDTNIEALRILAMLCIIVLHYLNDQMGGALIHVVPGEKNYVIARILESVCIVGPNVFVAISAYFTVNAAGIKLRKIADIYLTMIFWETLFYIVSMIAGAKSFSLSEVVLIFAPFLKGRRWFIETYILLLLFAPFLNLALHALSKKGFRVLIAVQLTVFSLWPSFLTDAPVQDAGYGIVNFMTIYIVVAYFRLHVPEDRIAKRRGALCLIWIGCTALVTVMQLLPGLKGNLPGVLVNLCGRAWNYDHIFNIASSVSLFLLVKSIRVPQSRFVNAVAGTTLGVLLIHSDVSMWRILYSDILHCESFYHAPTFILHAAASCVGLFAVSAALETLRKKLWRGTVDAALDRAGFLNRSVCVGRTGTRS